MRRYNDNSFQLTISGVPVQSGLPFVEFLYSVTYGEIYHVVRSEQKGRIDLISYDYFNDSKFWPYIGWYNDIIDPIREILPGRVLTIPIDALNRGRIQAFTYRQPVDPPVVVFN